MAETEKTENTGTTKLKAAEIEKKIVELAEQGEKPAKIGLILRDQYGVPNVRDVLGKKIEKYLGEKNIEYKSELKTIREKLQHLKQHLENNKHDYTAQRALTKQLWAARKAEKQQ